MLFAVACPAQNIFTSLLSTGKPWSQLVGSLTHTLHHMPTSAPVCEQCNMAGGHKEEIGQDKSADIKFVIGGFIC